MGREARIEAADASHAPTPLWAGFECARLHWNGHDLLETTGHLPHADMTHHYTRAIHEGCGGARDGLSWRHAVAPRVAAVPAGFPVIWDLVHFDSPRSPVAHALHCASLLGPDDWVIAVNEPSVGRKVSGETKRSAIRMALTMMRAIATSRAGLRFATCDPMHHVDDRTFEATDALVESGLIGLVGVNYYPHHAAADLADVLRAAHARYGLPVMLTETSWHDGHPGNRRFPHLKDRWDWLAHVHAEIERSRVPVEAIVWYPWLDMPPWDHPDGARWPSGWPGLGE